MWMKFYLTIKVFPHIGNLESFLQVNVTFKKKGNIKETNHCVQYTNKSVAMSYERICYAFVTMALYSVIENFGVVTFCLSMLYPGKIDLKFSYLMELKVTLLQENFKDPLPFLNS